MRSASRAAIDLPAGVEACRSPDLGPHADWREALREVDVVVHLAARVHVMREASSDPLAEFRRCNVAGTLRLAQQAAGAHVRRLIYLSSIKVNGESTAPGRPYTADDSPAPRDPYGVSKLEAERALQEVSATSRMETVIIRPPLVYGPGVKANFERMMRWLRRGIPLPLGAVRNRRSLLALDNLVDLIRVCLTHPAAADRVFLAADGEDLSTPDLLRRLGRALGVSPRLVPFPVPLLRAAGRLTGHSEVVERLCGSLQVSIASTRERLRWTPPVGVDVALERAARHFLARR